MGSRGPIPAKRQRAATTADGVKFRRVPEDPDAILRWLWKNTPGVTIADIPLLMAHAAWIHTLIRTDKELRGAPLTVLDTAHGNGEEERKNPLLIILRTASEQIRANAQQLGATPMARARMPEPEHEQMSLADILFSDVAATNE